MEQGVVTHIFHSLPPETVYFTHDTIPCIETEYIVIRAFLHRETTTTIQFTVNVFIDPFPKRKLNTRDFLIGPAPASATLIGCWELLDGIECYGNVRKRTGLLEGCPAEVRLRWSLVM